MRRTCAAAAALASLSLIGALADASGACPRHAPGVVELPGALAEQWRFVATSAVEAGTTGDADRQGPLNEARLEARAMLLADPRARRHMRDERLRGAQDLHECWTGDKVYASVGVDWESYARAAELEAQLRGATQGAPAISPVTTAPGGAGPDESVFERLMGVNGR